jgi:Na+/H+-dicarboxylate symporter
LGVADGFGAFTVSYLEVEALLSVVVFIACFAFTLITFLFGATFLAEDFF